MVCATHPGLLVGTVNAHVAQHKFIVWNLLKRPMLRLDIGTSVVICSKGTPPCLLGHGRDALKPSCLFSQLVGCVVRESFFEGFARPSHGATVLHILLHQEGQCPVGSCVCCSAKLIYVWIMSKKMQLPVLHCFGSVSCKEFRYVHTCLRRLPKLSGSKPGNTRRATSAAGFEMLSPLATIILYSTWTLHFSVGVSGGTDIALKRWKNLLVWTFPFTGQHPRAASRGAIFYRPGRL